VEVISLAVGALTIISNGAACPGSRLSGSVKVKSAATTVLLLL
jgi:hypothetical protein